MCKAEPAATRMLSKPRHNCRWVRNGNLATNWPANEQLSRVQLEVCVIKDATLCLCTPHAQTTGQQATGHTNYSTAKGRCPRNDRDVGVFVASCIHAVAAPASSQAPVVCHGAHMAWLHTGSKQLWRQHEWRSTSSKPCRAYFDIQEQSTTGWGDDSGLHMNIGL